MFGIIIFLSHKVFDVLHKEYEFDGYSKQSLQVFLKSANDYIAKSEPDIVFEILQKVNDNSNERF